jgi:hypothetical protein
MVKWLILALAFFGLIYGVAHSQTHTQCPGSNQSWSFGLPAPFQWAVFDLDLPIRPQPINLIPSGAITILYPNKTAETFIGVSQTVAQKWAYTTPTVQQVPFFFHQIKPVYHELLLISGSNCPLMLDGTHAVWTK